IPDVEIECGNCNSKSVLEMCTRCSGNGTIGSGKCGDCDGSGKLYSACRHAWDGEINYNVTGPVLNFLNIDTLGTAVMSSYHYEKKDRITIKMGGKSGAKSSTAGMRLNSIWFRAFNLSAIGVLPTKLNDFNAKYDNQNVILTWATEQERNFNHFIIEKSINGTDFKEETIIFGKDNGAVVKQYSFIDNLSSSKKGITSGYNGIIYYRLRLVDMNMTSQKSVIRIIKISEMNDVKVQAFPNPVVNELRITVPSAWQNKPVIYDLYAINGKIVRRVVTKNANQTEVLHIKDLNPGVYVVRVSSGNETVTKQVVKNSL
ncbi:MAG: T9SS type A sorting domain-containing protein, partial [Flavitalea sp.]